MSRPLFTFATTDHALWAEEVAREGRIPAELVPSPPEAEALCDLALETFPDRVGDLSAALGEAGVECRLWTPVRSAAP